jgi:FAD-dependent urate hydroxylase
MAYRDRDGAPLCDLSLDPLVARVGERPYPVRRADLQALLLGAVGAAGAAGAGVVEIGRRCLAVEQHEEGVVVRFEDGAAVEADLVVAADGTHSRLRDQVIGRPTAHTYLGYHNWNGLVPDELALGEPTTWTMYVGDGRRVSTMPVRDAQYVFFDVPLDDPTLTGCDPHTILGHHFAGWGPNVGRLIDGLDPAGVANVAIHSHEPLERMARGRLALLGDAAHTSAPDLGQGGCMAMEDGLVLANFLTTTNLGVADALQRYSVERASRAADILRRAANRARVTHGHDPARTAEWYAELGATDGTDIIDGICQSIESGPLR